MTSGSKMISRRQIIRGQQELPISMASGGCSKPASQSSQSTQQSGSSGANVRGQQSRAPGGQAARKLTAGAPKLQRRPSEPELQQDSSDGYVMNPYEDYEPPTGSSRDGYWRPDEQQEAAGYRHFDPYSVYSEDEEVWYSEERLFEDHLDEIFNKWRLLDDDIWCKLIIMERNRRIGKAYARVPIVTIDGSHTLSYDGYKLALNGFDNPDRDAKTEECRKRIGKGIRIKMDNFGNILIKRLSKSGVYIKEWLQPVSNVSSSSSNGRLMPSRQQLIKNQNAMLAAMGSGPNRVASSLANSVTPSSSSGGSSMDPPNDSAVCDEVMSLGGRLEQDKIYVMFDMKKFQANITQELCRPYPDKRKLEQQCFSIVGLARDADDILNLPCWVMVINIVAIEMLNERFPTDHHHTNFPDTMLSDPSAHHRHRQPPNFVNIFNHNGKSSECNKEEDPYSLPANASSSDVKSSINDYGTASTKHISSMLTAGSNHHQHQHNGVSSRYYGASRRAEMYAHKREVSRNGDLRQRSKSNCNIYGSRQAPASATGANGRLVAASSRYNNSSSIYSPGHMLVPPSGDSVPPKLPPRDFVKKGKSKSSSNISYDDGDTPNSKIDPNNESIYSTGLPTANNNNGEHTDGASKIRKAKKNRFLESLKAPLELAKSNKSASVLGAPAGAQSGDDKKSAGSTKSKGFAGKSKNLKSFLGVKSSKSKDSVSDDSNYVHVDETGIKTKAASSEADSVVGSNEEVEDSQRVATTESTSSSATASYDDLDIPTPDYETDENIYTLEEANHRHSQSGYPGQSSGAKKSHDTRRLAVSNDNHAQMAHNKDDLYYSGFRAHIPNSRTLGASASGKHHDDKLSCANGRESNGSRAMGTNATAAGGNKMLISSKLSGREMIYGSTSGLQSMASSGSRHRSASMQRYHSRSQMATGIARVAPGDHHHHHQQLQLQQQLHHQPYDLDGENPYAMSGLASDTQAHYGITGGHRSRRSSSRLGSAYASGMSRVASSVANSNYDIGRSSSGIYRNNSSSSGSDYADWHPQMRKVNSGGYLNSIFKNHMSSPAMDSYATNPLNGNNSANPMATNGYNNNQAQLAQQQRTSRTLKSSARAASSLSKQQQQLQQQKQQVIASVANGPTYRSYDSSNDSEPSYTNSSDGLDIYDQIGAHGRISRHQFLNSQPVHNMAPEVHVGEWENMYER